MSETVSPRAQQHAAPAGVVVLASDAEALAAAATYAAAIRPEAIARDREGRLPLAELEDLARTGLLGIRVPRAHGGAEVSNVTLTEVVRRIAVADPAIAQIPQPHWAFVETITRFGSDEQRELLCAEVLEGARLGNALAERGGKTARDWVTRLTQRGDGTLRLAAAKAFAGEVALRVATEIFDFSGASAADIAHGLDRHWRNARTHTLHDPARSKHLHLGRWAIDGVGPTPDHVLI